MDKIHYDKLFPSSNHFVPEGLFLNSDLLSFATPISDSNKIIKIIEYHCVNKNLNINNLTIVDATGGGGSDTIYFSNHFRNVITIEINKDHYAILKNNIKCYNLNNVISINGDSLDVLPKISFYDILYIDPPWGGKDYKKVKSISLDFGNIKLENAVINFFDNDYMQSVPHFIVLKLPVNYNLKKMFKKLDQHNLEIFLYKLYKKNILIIQKKYLV